MNMTIHRRNFQIDAFWLKLFAIAGMTLDHIGIVFGDRMSLAVETAFYALGGLTFPIMAFLLVEGYKHTSNLIRYGMRLLLFGTATQVPYMWVFGNVGNIFFTLLLGLIILYLYDSMKNRTTFLVVFIGAVLLSIFCDWGLIGVPMILLYHVLQGRWSRLVAPVALCFCMSLVSFLIPLIFESSLAGLPTLAFAVIGCSLTVPLLDAYSGKRGHYNGNFAKYLFYIYYPLHILILGLLRSFVFKG